LIHTAVEICLTATTVDILLRGARVWLHVRSYVPGRHTTIPNHMPNAHRAHLEWSPSRLIGWGATIGRHTEALVQALLESRPHPEQGYRSCLGIFAIGEAAWSGAYPAAQRHVAPITCRGPRDHDGVDGLITMGGMRRQDAATQTQPNSLRHSPAAILWAGPSDSSFICEGSQTAFRG
jgi:hypothetical protein